MSVVVRELPASLSGFRKVPAVCVCGGKKQREEFASQVSGIAGGGRRQRKTLGAGGGVEGEEE